jgi:arabinan endo-1,5-alpha-L-arabinosidase
VRKPHTYSRRQAFERIAAVATTLAVPRFVAAQSRRVEPTGDIAPVHDPCVIKHEGTFHLFCTGQLRDATGLLPWRISRDLAQWQLRGRIFDAIPAWASAAVPGVAGLWAPDIAYFNERFHVYYSVSTFGSNVSAIGLVTNRTLDPNASQFGWRDEGLVVASARGDDFNAIDPNHVVDLNGDHWLALGSFWSGLKLFPLDRATGKLAKGDARRFSLAARPAPEGGPGAIEAPFIIERGGRYYLFASYDYCCRGVSSSYYLAVGRAERITGPYLGRDGRSMQEGFGTSLLRGDRRFRGPGHCAVLRDGEQDYLVYHAYDAEHEGRATLRIAPLEWQDGWPAVNI